MLFDLLQQHYESHLFPGCVVGTVTKNKNGVERHIWKIGHFTDESTSHEVSENTIYDCASVTKSIPTASLAWKLHEEGIVDFDEKIIDFFPHVHGLHAHRVTIQHLLDYTVVFPHRLSRMKALSAQEMRDVLEHSNIDGPPGEYFAYSNTASILLGWILELKRGEKLDTLAHRYFFEPLQMNDSVFTISKEQRKRIPPTEIDDWRGGVVQAQVHDESAWILSREYGPVGAAGLFSTVPDLLNFVEMMLGDGVFRGKHILSADTIRAWQNSRQIKSGQNICSGWEWRPSHWAGESLSPTSIGKNGFTGCSVVVDWEKQTGVVILSNAIYPQRPENRRKLNQFRSEVMSACLQ
jgi:CubicO group peptidase (beta-lactamase class C family)